MFDFEIDKDDITRAGVFVFAPHESCAASYRLQLTWRTLYEIAFGRATKVDGAMTQRLANGSMRIAFTCERCMNTYAYVQRPGDKASLTTVHLDISPNEALEMIQAGNQRGFPTRQLAGI